MSLSKKYYKALLEKDSSYEGIFYVGVKTTGVFCRPTCPARKPKFEHCQFFKTAEDALLASYRPCKRCKPLSHPDQFPEIVQKLVEAVEENPEKRWKERDFEKICTNAVQASRLFKKRFGMTFVAYARARRMGIAFKEIQTSSVIDAQVLSGYESGSGFRDAFSKIMGKPPKKAGKVKVLKAAMIDTVLGPMIAISDEELLYLLEFTGRRGLEREVEKLRKKLGAAIIPGDAKPLKTVKKDLQAFFSGKRLHFETKFALLGSPFQVSVWKELLKIPIGETRSYADIAEALGRPTAYRAVAQANGTNQLGLIIPCHRVINKNGDLGGYGGGIPKKKWLLEHEKKYA